MQQIYIWETAGKSSTFRGVGRYVSLLKESIPSLVPLSNLASAISPSTIIHPFFNLIGDVAKSYIDKINTRKITIIHDIIPLKYPKGFPLGFRGRLRSRVNIRLARKLDTIVTDSQSSKQDLVTICGIQPEKIQVIYPYASAQIQPEQERTNDTLVKYNLKKQGYFIYVGDVNWNKNILNIAKAIKDTPFTLVCVGKAFTEEIPKHPHPWQKELASFHKLVADDPRVICTGLINDQELAHLYKNAIYNILISRDEGFGFSYLEAAKQSTPSILADRPIFHEVSQDKGAIFVDPEKPDAIVQTLHICADDHVQREQKGAEAYQHQTTYNKERFAEDWRVLLGDL
ncbi:MAG: glycosyltransferase [Candidatus Roizmanbacteria bacterium]